MEEHIEINHKKLFEEPLTKKSFDDANEWPKFARVKIARGKFYDEQIANTVFIAVRLADEKKGRFVYDLYIKDNLYLSGVNPLFLDFV